VELLKQYEIFLHKGSVDLRAATHLYADFQAGDLELDLEVVLFHCQQATEKFFKALLSYSQIHITKTHNLRELFKLIEDSAIVIPQSMKDLLPLTFFAVEGRYGIIHDDLADTEQYFLLLAELKEFVMRTIQM